jgi:hypothetical protein
MNEALTTPVDEILDRAASPSDGRLGTKRAFLVHEGARSCVLSARRPCDFTEGSRLHPRSLSLRRFHADRRPGPPVADYLAFANVGIFTVPGEARPVIRGAQQAPP